MTFFPPDAPGLDGSIGLDLFAGHAVTFALAQQELIVESPQSLASRIDHATQVPLRIVRDAQGLALTADIGVATPDGTAWRVIPGEVERHAEPGRWPRVDRPQAERRSLR